MKTSSLHEENLNLKMQTMGNGKREEMGERGVRERLTTSTRDKKVTQMYNVVMITVIKRYANNVIKAGFNPSDQTVYED